MNKLILEAVVARCRQRIADGDCPTVPATGLETLENAVADLADDVQQLRSERSRLLDRLEYLTTSDCVEDDDLISAGRLVREIKGTADD